MKILFTIIFLAAGLNATAQKLGINIAAPNATLEVVGEASNAAAPDGFIAPRLTRAQLIAKTGYGTDQNGAMVYVTDLSGATNTSTAQVTQPGYYVFDGTAWFALARKKRVSAYVNAGGAVSLGNISARLAASGSKSLEISFTNAVASVSGAANTVYRASDASSGGSSASEAAYMRQNGADGENYWTAGTWIRWEASRDYSRAGSTQQIFINDATNKIAYKVTLMVGFGFNNNFISIEQL